MRTAAKAVAELKSMDPGTEVTEYHIRQLIRTGALPVMWAGSKALINLDDVLALMHSGTVRVQPEPPTLYGIRRINVR